MLWIAIFNLGMIALGAAVGTGMISTARTESSLGWLYAIVGVTPPPREKTRLFALVWIVSLIAIVDGLLFMLVLLTHAVM